MLHISFPITACPKLKDRPLNEPSKKRNTYYQAENMIMYTQVKQIVMILKKCVRMVDNEREKKSYYC